MRRNIHILAGVIFIIIIISSGIKFLLLSRGLFSGQQVIEIEMFDGTQYYTYYAKEISKETERCIDFINLYNKKQRICGENYSITSY